MPDNMRIKSIFIATGLLTSSLPTAFAQKAPESCGLTPNLRQSV